MRGRRADKDTNRRPRPPPSNSASCRTTWHFLQLGLLVREVGSYPLHSPAAVEQTSETPALLRQDRSPRYQRTKPLSSNFLGNSEFSDSARPSISRSILIAMPCSPAPPRAARLVRLESLTYVGAHSTAPLSALRASLRAIVRSATQEETRTEAIRTSVPGGPAETPVAASCRAEAAGRISRRPETRRR